MKNGIEKSSTFIIQKMCLFCSLSVELDITPLKDLYASMIWLLSDSVNEFKEFRTCLVNGKLGVFDSMNPSYTIFNKENKNFA